MDINNLPNWPTPCDDERKLIDVRDRGHDRIQPNNMNPHSMTSTMDATKFSQPWLTVPMSGKDATDTDNNCHDWRPGCNGSKAEKNRVSQPAYTYLPWLGNVLVGR